MYKRISYSLIALATFIVVFVSCQQSNPTEAVTTIDIATDTTIDIVTDTSDYSAIFNDLSTVQDVSSEDVIVVTSTTGDFSLDKDFFQDSDSLQTLSIESLQENIVATNVLANSDGYVVFFTHDATNLTEPYKIWRHDQATDTLKKVYGGIREVQSVSISLDGDTVAAVMDSQAVPANKEVFRFIVSTDTSEQLTTTTADEADVSISGDATVLMWQGHHPTTGRKSLNYRIYTDPTTFTDNRLARNHDVLDPNLNQNAELAVFAQMVDGTNYSDGKDRWIIYAFNLETQSLTPVLGRAYQLTNPSLNDDSSQLLVELLRSSDNKLVLQRFNLITQTGLTIKVQDQSVHPHLSADGNFATYGRVFPDRVITAVQNLSTGDVAFKNISETPNGHVWQKPSQFPFLAVYVSSPAANSTIDFSSVVQGIASDPQIIAVSNTGGSPLSFGHRITGAHASDFAVLPAGDITIANGGSPQNLTLNCTPSDIGTRTASLVVTTNDIKQLRVEYDLTCEGTAVPKVVSISTGAHHSCQVKDDGTAECWGYAAGGQLGNGTIDGIISGDKSQPVAVLDGAKPETEKWSMLSAGTSHTCGITAITDGGTGGAAYCWGHVGNGRLGNSTITTNQSEPIAVEDGAKPEAEKWTMISAGFQHTCGITDSGAAYCWGAANGGILGNLATTGAQSSPVAVQDGAKPESELWTAISVGSDHSCAITDAGAAYCWGNEANGRLGNGINLVEIGRPNAVDAGGKPSSEKWTSITAGKDHSCGVTDSGAAYCWGEAASGQLGNTGSTDQFSPAAVLRGAKPESETWTSIDAAYQHSCGLSNTGSLYCWGQEKLGSLGNNVLDGSIQASPVAVAQGANSNNDSVTALATGTNHSCAVLSTGKTLCWGLGQFGKLGTGATSTQAVPSAVMEP